jgi:V8-like Glu-specific endopeptidase
MTATRVTNTIVPPHPAVGYLAMRWSTTGTWAYGSGALINSTNILTCSHNIVDPITDPEPRGVALEIRFFPGYNQVRTSSPPAGGLNVAVGFYSNAFAGGQDAWDVGVCRLASPYDLSAFFTPTVTGEEIIHEDILLTGYPGPQQGEMWEDFDQVAGVELTTNTLIYTHDTWAGNSGSPTWTYDAVSDVVQQHGIHVSREEQELRRAVLITDQIRQWIANAVSQPTPHSYLLVGL